MMIDIGLPLVIGLAIFLFGMKVMELALYNWTGSHLHTALHKLTNTPLRGLISGTGITALLQSSTAVTVITIGLVNAGILTFPRTLGIILGTNIGTCLTVELISLNITHYALPALIIFFCIWLLSHFLRYDEQHILPRMTDDARAHSEDGSRAEPMMLIEASGTPVEHSAHGRSHAAQMELAERLKHNDLPSRAKRWARGVHAVRCLSMAIVGFSCVLLGMEVMHSIAPALETRGLMTWFIEQAQHSLIWGVLAGAILTLIIQSSTATIAIAMGLATAQLMSIELGIAIVLGANIGTCGTAFIASIGGSRSGQLVAWAHIILNVGGVVLFFPLIHLLCGVSAMLTASPATQLAHAQTIFNIVCSVLALPICYMRFIERIRVS